MPKSNVGRYSLTMGFVNHADQDLSVTEAEDGGAQLEFYDLNDYKESKQRLYLDYEEIDRVIQMLTVIKEHIKAR